MLLNWSFCWGPGCFYWRIILEAKFWLLDIQRFAGGCPRALSCIHAQEGTARSQEKKQPKGLEGTIPRAHIGPLESLLPLARIENLIIHRVLGGSSFPLFHKQGSGERWSSQLRHPVIRWRNMSRMAGLPYQPLTIHFWFRDRIVSSIAGLPQWLECWSEDWRVLG